MHFNTYDVLFTMFFVYFVTDDQQDATFWFIYLYPISSTCFRQLFAHHQEHLTVLTASDIVHYVAAGWQQHRWTHKH